MRLDLSDASTTPTIRRPDTTECRIVFAGGPVDRQRLSCAQIRDGVNVIEVRMRSDPSEKWAKYYRTSRQEYFALDELCRDGFEVWEFGGYTTLSEIPV